MTARPYVSIYVAIDTPNAPRLDGKPVRCISWTAHRFSREGAPIEYGLSAHHGDAIITPLAEGSDLPAILAATSDWVPRPPTNWLASLRMTAEPDRIAQASAAMDRAYGRAF